MQTKAQAMRKIRSMMKATRESILKEAEQLLSSGAIDLEAEEDNFRVPKMVLYIAMRNAADGWSPLSWNKQEKKYIKNLSRF